ncbi:MAG: hypothetical protein ACXWR4_18335 [Bdellovibrionota bacterium]
MKALRFALFAGFLSTLGTPVQGFARDGGVASGGGDRCEERFQAVARDLAAWIRAGGPAALNFGGTTTPEAYSAKMLEQIGKARITCVAPGDDEYPVTVNGKPKECRNFVDEQGVSRIVCDYDKFYGRLADPENDPVQYRIVHHEFASLAGIERPEEDRSHYQISDQITAFLADQLVKRLVVKPAATPPAIRARVMGTFSGRNQWPFPEKGKPCSIVVTDYQEFLDPNAVVTDPEHQSKLARKFTTRLALPSSDLNAEDRNVLHYYGIPFHDENGVTWVETGLVESDVDASIDNSVRPPRATYAYQEETRSSDYLLLSTHGKPTDFYRHGARTAQDADVRLRYDHKRGQVTGIELMLGADSTGRRISDYPCNWERDPDGCKRKAEDWAADPRPYPVCYR